MEINNEIIGAKLSEIQKKPDSVRLVFENPKTKKIYILTFKGLLFETSGVTLNKRVKQIHLADTLGFRAITQLRNLQRKPENYRQLFIQMEGSNDENKFELVGAHRNLKILPKKLALLKKKTVPIKKAKKNLV